MDIKRIDNYTDERFSRMALLQHGAYLVDGEPYEFEITAHDRAVIRGKDPSVYPALIEEFRFHAPQVSEFYGPGGGLIAEYPKAGLINVELSSVQPSQFYVDEDKLAAVGSFIKSAEDVIVQVIPWENGFISLDGHTRLYLAALNGWERVRAVVSETDDWVWAFVNEARKCGVLSPADMKLVSHAEYKVLWDDFCDEVFKSGYQMQDKEE
jgi:hypothetical protein